MDLLKCHKFVNSLGSFSVLKSNSQGKIRPNRYFSIFKNTMSL